MAVDITPGTGKTVAADVVGTAHAPVTGEQIQYVKLDAGAAGASAPVTGAALADAAANPTSPMFGACLLVWNGATWDRYRAPPLRKDVSAVALGTIATLLTPTSGKKFRLLGGSLSLSAAASILFEDNTAGNFIYRSPKLLADTPFNFDLGPIGFLSAAANNLLKGTSSASANATGTLFYCEE